VGERLKNLAELTGFFVNRLLHVLETMIAGEVYTWGDNDEGQLGDGTTNAIQKPKLVNLLQGMFTTVL
jgi:alpha-tubulin suppressor-like RCC1 family protein